MIQFNFKRFSKLARWSLTNDRGFYLKNFLNVFVVLTLLFLCFTTNFIKINGHGQNYGPCCFAAFIMFMITIITGPSWMFSSMKSEHERQALLMLPASNLEKYLMRYSTWLLLLPLYIVAFFAADLIQYVVNVLFGHDGVMFVTTAMKDIVNGFMRGISPEGDYTFSNRQWRILHALIAVFLWIHSFYALGGTFFRSHKFAWVLTTVAFIVLTSLLIWVTLDSSNDLDKVSVHELVIWDVIYGAWFLLNFWLSYRCFCRQQVIGKFVNL